MQFWPGPTPAGGTPRLPHRRGGHTRRQRGKPRLRRDMQPMASIIVPTRHRAGYLDVALASIAPQAAAARAELLVVDDGPDDATRVVAHRHGARYVSHDRSRGLNAARN